MKYASIDIETTGLDPYVCHILEIGIVVEDTTKLTPIEELPKLHLYVRPKKIAEWMPDKYRWEEKAKEMNGAMADRILNGEVESVSAFAAHFLIKKFLIQHFPANGKGVSTVNAAGKNFAGFDLPFLRQYMDFDTVRFRHRVIDPAMLFVDWENDDCLPDLSECKRRAGLDGTVAHTAIEDAQDVIRLIRFSLPNAKSASEV